MFLSFSIRSLLRRRHLGYCFAPGKQLSYFLNDRAHYFGAQWDLVGAEISGELRRTLSQGRATPVFSSIFISLLSGTNIAYSFP